MNFNNLEIGDKVTVLNCEPYTTQGTVVGKCHRRDAYSPNKYHECIIVYCDRPVKHKFADDTHYQSFLIVVTPRLLRKV